ncbi:Putative ribonuclease H protein At1g65750, partial [Linum perenne]
MASDASCSRCAGVEESVIHVLRDCPAAAAVWSHLGFSSTNQSWQSPDPSEWVRELVVGPRSLIGEITCWYLWKARNQLIFEDVLVAAPILAARIKSWAVAVDSAIKLERGSLGLAPSRSSKDVCWDPGPGERLILNTDGSVDPLTGAELHGITTGLRLAWDAGYRRIVVQSDSTAAIALITSVDDPLHQHANEVLTIRNLLDRDWTVSLMHVFREANKATDFLADLGHRQQLGTHLISVSDCNLGYFLRLD